MVERHLKAKKPVSLVMAIPNHPWTKISADSAAVRIAMTVAEAGSKDGVLREVVREAHLDTDQPTVELSERAGTINSDLTVGVDVTAAAALLANEGLCSPGVKLHGSGFIVEPSVAEQLGLGQRPGLERHIREYRNGRDLNARPRGVMVIDLFGLEADDVRRRYPEVYQHLLTTVKPERDANNRESYRVNWWIFGEPRRELRPAVVGLERYLATVETSKHRIFEFLPATIIPDNKLVVIASDDPSHLGFLVSRIHTCWALRAGGWLGVGNDPVYVKSKCFDPFPFPDATESQKHRIREIAEELDAHRKRQQAAHPSLTLTDMYNVLERLRAGVQPDALNPAERVIFDDGLVLILKELHDRLDVAVADAYGWPANLSDEDILSRLVTLNKERAAEEARGEVRWLRPDYQIERFGTPTQKKEQYEADLVVATEKTQKPLFPADDITQTAAVMAALSEAAGALDAQTIATSFRQGRRIEAKVSAVLVALSRTGYVNSPDGGKSFQLPRAA